MYWLTDEEIAPVAGTFQLPNRVYTTAPLEKGDSFTSDLVAIGEAAPTIGFVRELERIALSVLVEKTETKTEQPVHIEIFRDKNLVWVAELVPVYGVTETGERGEVTVFADFNNPIQMYAGNLLEFRFTGVAVAAMKSLTIKV